MLTHKELKTHALKRPDVKKEYDRIEEEFSFLDEFLKARSSAGITQAEVAARIGTTQSAIARLESGKGKPSPSILTLQKYARAVGCHLELRLVNDKKVRQTKSQITHSANPI
jgi:transcriptional regulator with XRE-family HTH domain